MVVRDLDLKSVVPAPSETNSVLSVDAYAVLTLPAAVQLLQSVPGRDRQVLQRRGAIEHGQFPSRHAGWRRTPGLTRSPDFRRFFVGESLDHSVNITQRVNNVNRYAPIPVEQSFAVLYSY